MAIPLRVIQFYRLDEQDERVYTDYKLQVKTAEGWANVPVIYRREKEEGADREMVDIAVGGEYVMKC
jgi:hypothetical protein